MKKTIIVIVLLIGSFSLQAQSSGKTSQENTAEKIDQYLASALDAYRFNGVALVAQKGKLILHKAYGWKNVTNKTYNDTSTVFPILSITKSFTAMVILKL